MSFYRGRSVLVTGGCGFLGRWVVGQLQEAGARVRVTSRRPGSAVPRDVDLVIGDLRDVGSCRAAVKGIEIVFHLAAFGWGLGENVTRQPELLTTNVLINTNVLEAAYRAGVERYLFTSSSAVYPGHATVLEESQPWDAPPHASEACFGWAKRLGEVQARAYHEHYGMKVAIIRPTNPYGPWDNFDPATSHVVPALIQRVFAGQGPLTVWGSGRVLRSFVHARDVARGMLLALERYPVADPVNLASPEAVSIADLARLILDLAGRKPTPIVFDDSKPEGHPRKIPAIDKAERVMGFRAEIDLRTGLEETIGWFLASRTVARERVP